MENALTILIPVYNEEECLYALKKEVDQLLQKIPVSTEVLLVDDGSTDQSLPIIRKLCTDPGYRYISLRKNSGLSTAIKAGIGRIKTPYTAYMDADLQISPMALLDFIPFMYDYALINGIRMKRKDHLMKRLTSRIANRLRRWIIRDGILDTSCPLKLMHTSVLRELPFFKGMHRFLPALVKLHNGQVKQLPVAHFPRHAGKSKYNLSNRIIQSCTDTLAFYWMKKRKINIDLKEVQETESFPSTIV